MVPLHYYVNKIPNILNEIDRNGIELPDLTGSAFIGNGNAFHVARLYAMKYNGFVFRAEEVNRLPTNQKVCVISASGGKDSIEATKHFKDAVLLTCNPNAPSKNFAEKTIIIPSEEEPPFYNVTTYAGMIYLLERNYLNRPKKDIFLLKELEYNSIIFIASLRTHPIASMAALKMREIFGKMALSLTREEAYTVGFYIRQKKRA
jgi:fructoselysine-6-P-deglycase FrlB-like protein